MRLQLLEPWPITGGITIVAGTYLERHGGKWRSLAPYDPLINGWDAPQWQAISIPSALPITLRILDDEARDEMMRWHSGSVHRFHYGENVTPKP